MVKRVVDIDESAGPIPAEPTNKMDNASLKIIYQDDQVLAVDKPAGINSDDFEKRVHRLDKDTSGVLLIAKTEKSLEFLQKQFKDRKLEKKYTALVVGHLREEKGEVRTLLGRAPNDRRKQKAYPAAGPDSEGKREAVTLYKVLQKFKNYDLIEVEPKTGRKHQIRSHFVYLNHPLAGDKLYGFKNQMTPKGLGRQFLHAGWLKITLPDGQDKEFVSPLAQDLKEVLKNLEE